MTGKTHRRPVWIPLAAYFLLMPTMLWLGFWQLDKSQRQAERNEAFATQSEVAIDAADVDDPRLQRYGRVTAAGRYLGERQVLIDSIVRGGRNGFFVITPLQLDDGSTLLVNRGWIPQTPTRKPIGALDVGGERRQLAGRVGSLPVGGLRLGDVAEAGGPWPRRLCRRSSPPGGLDPSAPDGFEREWRPGGLPPERHLGYAVQWFAMAFALTLLAIIVAVRRPGTRNSP